MGKEIKVGCGASKDTKNVVKEEKNIKLEITKEE